MIIVPETYTAPVGYKETGAVGVAQAVFGNDKDIGIRFFIHALHRPAKSAAVGYEVFEDVEMVEFHIDQFTKSTRIVTEFDKKKYADLYDRFQRGLGSKGTLIEGWSIASPSDKAMLIHQGFITVDQLAECPDSRLEKMPPTSSELREKARQHVKAQSGKIEAEKLGDVILELQRKVAALADENTSLKDTLLGTAAKKKTKAKKEIVQEIENQEVIE